MLTLVFGLIAVLYAVMLVVAFRRTGTHTRPLQDKTSGKERTMTDCDTDGLEFRVVWTDGDGLSASSAFGTDWRTARSYMNLLKAMGLEPVMQAAVFEDVSDADLALLDEDDRVLGRKETSCGTVTRR